MPDGRVVPTADSCTAAKRGFEDRDPDYVTPPAQIRAGGSAAHCPDLGGRVDQPLPRQRDELERQKDGLRLSAAAVVNRTSFGMISSCSLARRSCPVRDPG